MDNEEKSEKQEARNILKILIVDDNKIISDLVKLMLISAGYECSITNNSSIFFLRLRSILFIRYFQYRKEFRLTNRY